MKKKICKNCGGEINNPRATKFCTPKCNSRYHARIRYRKIKNTRKFKNYRYNFFKKWRKKNREHFNALCLPKVKEYNKRIYYQRKDKGICVKCGGKIKDKRWYLCEKCRKIARERARRKDK